MSAVSIKLQLLHNLNILILYYEQEQNEYIFLISRRILENVSTRSRYYINTVSEMGYCL